MNILKRWWLRFRSAVTGKFVTRAEAEAHPNETVAEKIERMKRESGR